MKGTGAAEAISTQEGRDRLLKRWPSLPLLALGLGISWRFILVSNTLPIADTTASPCSTSR